ncbi:hypothetical protein DV515_00007351 [Chloebia gouldiae]|uniref:Uncharacterized protein n=1 Tax=Chloebia gouldiae TaxID=44316 RepID=A0A3L8SHP6_CHLGU|nr:hypothetical protein DV515_00007351 [Chloebia gouldiae]
MGAHIRSFHQTHVQSMGGPFSLSLDTLQCILFEKLPGAQTVKTQQFCKLDMKDGVRNFFFFFEGDLEGDPSGDRASSIFSEPLMGPHLPSQAPVSPLFVLKQHFKHQTEGLTGNIPWYENWAHDSYWEGGTVTFQARCTTRRMLSRAFTLDTQRERKRKPHLGCNIIQLHTQSSQECNPSY